LKGDRLLPAHHVARHCRQNDLHYAGKIPAGILECALVPDEDGLSVTWLEFFGGKDRVANMAGVRAAITAGLTPKPSNRLAVLNVGNIERAGSAASAAGLRVIEDPYTNPPPGNPAHALVKEAATLGDQKLREAIAATVQPADIETY
jgi:hypothetical protein